MSSEALTALSAGLVLGFSYAIAGYLMSRRALASPDRFMLWITGGMAIRMLVALVIIAIVLATARIDKAIFLGAFLVPFIAGVVVEIVIAYRH